MEANPRHVSDLSVLVPVYGVERYIADCARSLFAQRDVDAEFVFVDDASPDGSVDRLREVMAEYPAVGERVRILRHAHNRGVGAARRTAIEAARGTYICFVDSDDALSDDRALAQLSEEARRTDADLIFGGYCEVSPAGRRRIHTPRPDRDRVLRSLLRQDYRTSNRLWGILIRRALHTRYGVWPAAGLNFAEDYVLLSQLVYRAARIAAVDRPFYAYRTANAGSCMNTLTRRSADAYVEANRVVTDFFRAQPDFERWRPALTLGKLNVAKWILMRGFSPSDYRTRLFTSDDAPIGLAQRLYAAALRTERLPLVRAVAAAVNALHS